MYKNNFKQRLFLQIYSTVNLNKKILCATEAFWLIYGSSKISITDFGTKIIKIRKMPFDSFIMKTPRSRIKSRFSLRPKTKCNFQSNKKTVSPKLRFFPDRTPVADAHAVVRREKSRKAKKKSVESIQLFWTKVKPVFSRTFYVWSVWICLILETIFWIFNCSNIFLFFVSKIAHICASRLSEIFASNALHNFEKKKILFEYLRLIETPYLSFVVNVDEQSKQ